MCIACFFVRFSTQSTFNAFRKYTTTYGPACQKLFANADEDAMKAIAGEVLDVDAVTGGFNLQIAWSTAYAAATSIV